MLVWVRLIWANIKSWQLSQSTILTLAPFSGDTADFLVEISSIICVTQCSLARIKECSAAYSAVKRAQSLFTQSSCSAIVMCMTPAWGIRGKLILGQCCGWEHTKIRCRHLDMRRTFTMSSQIQIFALGYLSQETFVPYYPIPHNVTWSVPYSNLVIVTINFQLNYCHNIDTVCIVSTPQPRALCPAQCKTNTSIVNLSSTGGGKHIANTVSGYLGVSQHITFHCPSASITLIKGQISLLDA